MSFADCLNVFGRHRRVAVFAFLSVLAFAWLVLVLCPSTYESEAKLFLRVGRENVGLDPTATTGQTLLLQKNQEDEINSALEILTSRQLMEEVVDELGVANILKGNVQDEKTRSWMHRQISWCLGRVIGVAKSALELGMIAENVGEREQAIRTITRHVFVRAPKNSTVITVRSEANSPEAAQAICQAMVDAYVNNHLRIRQTQGSLDFFTDRSAELHARLEEKSATRRDYKQQYGVLTIEANQELLANLIGTTRTDLQIASRDLALTKARAAELQEQLAKLPKEVIDSTTNTTWAGMRQRLFELQVTEQELRASKGERHPSVTEVRTQRERLETILNDHEPDRDETFTQNPVRQETEQILLGEQVTLLGLEAKVKDLDTQLDALEEDQRELAGHEVVVSDLERELAILDETYRSNQVKLAEATTIDELDRRRVSNVSIAQPASFVEKRISPKPSIVLPVALLAAIGAATGLAFQRDAADPTVRSVEHVERFSGLQVTTTIPRLRAKQVVGGIGNNRTHDRIASACDELVSRALLTANDGPLAIGVMGSDRGVGGSSLASQLALSAGDRFGLSTILIDADQTSGSVAKLFSLNGAPGFSELVNETANLGDCVQHFESRHLDLISAREPSGRARPLNPKSVLRNIEKLKQQYDMVVVDLPPAHAATSGISTTPCLDGVFLVVEPAKTVRSDLRRLTQKLEQVGTRVLGVVINKA